MISGCKHKRLPAIALALLLVAILPYSDRAEADWVGAAEPHMGTEVSVYLWHDDPDMAQQAVAAVFEEVARLDRMMSTYIEDSRISEINRDAASRPVNAGSELYRLIERSLDISVLTRGAFDITYDSVGQHYDFRERRRPDEQTIAEELPLIDYRFVVLDPAAGTVR